MFDHTKKLNVVDYKGRTPKNLAEENGHLEVAKLFEKQQRMPTPSADKLLKFEIKNCKPL